MEEKPRVFSGVAVDGKIEEELRAAKAVGKILDFQREGSNLVVYRSPVNGDDIRTFFGKDDFANRQLYSLDVFLKIIAQLDRRVHGAIHPNNVRQSDGEPVLLDWVANAARLRATPRFPLVYDIWLWRSCIPGGLDIHVWDRLNLVRMVTLLAKGEDHWIDPVPFAKMVQDCRSWIKDCMLLPSGEAGVKSQLKEILADLEMFISLLSVSPLDINRLSQIEEIIKGKMNHQGDRMLRAVDEDIIIQETLSWRMDAALYISVALQMLEGQREKDVLKVVDGFLQAGLYQEAGRCVRGSACRNAERFLVGLGMEQEEAAKKVADILRKSRRVDSRALELEWLPYVKEYLDKNCVNLRYNSRHLAHMVKMVTRAELPEDIAKIHLRNYLDKKNYIMEKTWSWI
jgi:hypothetical protein